MVSDSTQEQAIKVRDYARIEGVTTSAVYKLIQAGVITPLRTGVTGRGIRIVPSEARAALRSRAGWVDPASHTRGNRA